MALRTPYIPETITVHLAPPAQYAANVTVSFADYIKNVASSEIYPTWNEEALRANIYAQISYAVNRVYTEFYRSQGYDFDITNSTSIDQKFINGRNIFENIDQIVSEIFNVYISRVGQLEPLAAKFCNGTTTTCDGLSQWGSEALANQGYQAFPILQHYYGDDIELVSDAPIQNMSESYPGTALRVGSSGTFVETVQVELNRISQNYPLIPKISPVDGVFDEDMENSVKTFQQIFNLAVDGIVGKATWYKLVNLYVGVTKLAELNSEGVRLFTSPLEYPDTISRGESGNKVEILQYFLSVLNQFYIQVPPISGITGFFGEETENAVKAFQQQFQLPVTGVVDAATWYDMYNAFMGIANTVFLKNEVFAIQVLPYGGEPLKLGSQGDSVSVLQQYLNALSLAQLQIDPVQVTGTFDQDTENAVKEYQKLAELPETGIVDQTVWNSITNSYQNLLSEFTSSPRQYPGKTLSEGDSDVDWNTRNGMEARVRKQEDSSAFQPSFFGDAQTFPCGTNWFIPQVGQPIRGFQTLLQKIAHVVPGIPALIPDGQFGPQTTAAVKAFQKTYGCPQTGCVDFETWSAIVLAHDEAGIEVNEPVPASIYPCAQFKIAPGESPEWLCVLQAMMCTLCRRFENLDLIAITGVHDIQSQKVVGQFQVIFGGEATGVIDKTFWNRLSALYHNVITSAANGGAAPQRK